MGINGSPDLMGCVGPLCVVIEVKDEDGKTSPLQEYKMNKIKECGAIALVIKPSNFEASVKFLENLSKNCEGINERSSI